MLGSEVTDTRSATRARGGPIVRVVADDAGRAARLAQLLAEHGAETRVAAGAGLAAALRGAPADAVVVIVEGFEAVLGALPGRNVQLVALEPTTPALFGDRWVLPAHAPGALAAWMVALAERARLERKVMDAESGMQALLAEEQDGLIVVDDLGRVLVANDAASELVGSGLLQAGAPLPFAAPDAAARRVLTLNGQAVTAAVKRLGWGGGEARLVRLRPAAGPESFEGRFAHTDRLAAVGALAAGFAHEVNNPAQTLTADLTELGEQLRVIERGIARTAAAVEEPERAQLVGLGRPLTEAFDLVQNCFDGLGRIASIVRDLKSFSRIQPDRVDWVHPNEIVNQACAIAHNHVRHRAQMVKELAACEPFPGDRHKLVQVVTNLLVNAGQALEGTEEARIIVRTRSEAGQVIISVVDNGPGIPPDVLGRIFEPFFTTKTNADGTGLGLALSLDIARQHGGTLEVETATGTGTRFDLMLPVENGLVVERKAVETRPQEILQRGRILVVDDEPGILRSLGRLIGRTHEVETRSSGQSALALLGEDDRFDVILSDLMMPEVDGPMLHEVLLARAPHLARRMVFMSGGAFTERAQRFLERVKPVVLDKPAPASLLERAIQQMLASCDETAELPPGAAAAAAKGPPTRSFA